MNLFQKLQSSVEQANKYLFDHYSIETHPFKLIIQNENNWYIEIDKLCLCESEKKDVDIIKAKLDEEIIKICKKQKLNVRSKEDFKMKI